ncbi:hypothetical protein ACFE04_015781 [Oxalis oulophora]
MERMFNLSHTESRSKQIYSDRFIPSRTGSNFELFNVNSTPKLDNNDDPAIYDLTLRAALFGSETTQQRIFRYKSETKRNMDTLGFDGIRFSQHCSPTQRKVATTPWKVLDVPELPDDYYSNLVDWSPNNLLAVGLGTSVYLWNGHNGEVTKLCDLETGGDSVCSVAWAQDGTNLSIGSYNGNVQIWDVSCCERVRTVEGHQKRVGVLAWSSSLLSSGSLDKSILQHDPRVQKDFVSKLSGHTLEVCGLKWSYDNRELASGGNDNRLNIWNQHSTKPVLKHNEHKAAVKAIDWSPHLNGLLASGGGSADRCIRFWNTTTNRHLNCIDTGSQVCNLLWSKNSNALVSSHGFSQNEIIVWKYPTMSKLATLTGHSSRVLYLTMSPDGLTIVTGAGDETLRFWNIFPATKSRSTDSKFEAISFGRTTIR